MRNISVVIPVFNSEEILPILLQRLTSVLSRLASEYEVILVNDCSRDRSWEVTLEVCKQYENVQGINLMRNYGQHNALLCGIRSARYDLIVTMDDDLQHPPEEISTLLKKLEEGYEVVYGIPITEQHGLWRDMASQATKLVLQKAMGAEIARKVSAFRMFKTKLREAFSDYSSPFLCIDVLLTWGTTSFAMVPVKHESRYSGVSNYTVRKLLSHAIDLITGFTIVPLQFAGYVGILFMFFGLILLVVVLGRYFIQGITVHGFTFLASVIIIFSGTQLFILGVLGEYLARMHIRITNRPVYVIRETTSPQSES